jgi:hypothetical protein
MATRQIIVLKTVNPADDDDGEGAPALGTQSEVLATLARFNTAPDNSGPGKKAELGLATLFGPGMVIEYSTAQREVRQLMVAMTDLDFAFPVLQRLCREQRWTLLDPETGQRLPFGRA